VLLLPSRAGARSPARTKLPPLWMSAAGGLGGIVFGG
jgi:hypothetical protein